MGDLHNVKTLLQAMPELLQVSAPLFSTLFLADLLKRVLDVKAGLTVYQNGEAILYQLFERCELAPNADLLSEKGCSPG